MRRITPFLLALLAPVATTSAQVPDWVTQIIAAAQLPIVADSARREGVPGADVRAALEALKTANVPAHEAKDVMDEARKSARTHGPVDNFGAFVQSKLAAGLRGRELAAAIRAEHAARGKGRAGQPGTKGNAPDARDTRGKAGQARDTMRGASQKGANPNASGTKGRPDAKGRQPDSKRPSTSTL